MKKVLLASLFCFSISLFSSAATATKVGTMSSTGGGGNTDTGGGGTGTSTSTDTGTGSGTGTGTGSNTSGSGGTGIVDNGSISLNVMVYPNPTSGDLFIAASVSNQLSNVKLYNSTGSLLFESNDKIQKLDLREYPAGIYYLQATTNNSEKYLNKIIKAVE